MIIEIYSPVLGSKHILVLYSKSKKSFDALPGMLP